MAVPARLKWRREGRGFKAYPMGFHQPERCAQVELMGTHTIADTVGVKMWRWSVTWPGWFDRGGSTGSKQDSADRATQAWWEGVASPIPRDVKTEIAIIAARVLVLPVPNSIYGEDAPFLRSLLQTLRLQYDEEMQRNQLPAPVKNLMSQLSEELYRRRLAGQSMDEVDDAASRWGVTGHPKSS